MELGNVENKDFKKVKVTELTIVSTYAPSKIYNKSTYYGIRYVDLNDGEEYVGYSSYDLNIVLGYIRDYFEFVTERENKEAVWQNITK